MEKDAKVPYGQIEPRLRTLVKAINSVPYLRTIGSCEGHPKRGDVKANASISLNIFQESKHEILWYKLIESILNLSFEKRLTVNISRHYDMWACKTYLYSYWEIVIRGSIYKYQGKREDLRSQLDYAFKILARLFTEEASNYRKMTRIVEK